MSENSTFAEALRILDEEWRKALHQQEALQEYIGVSNPELRHQRLVHESRIHWEVDEICQIWSETLKFPAMGPEAAVFVFDRFQQGVVFGAWLLKNGVNFSGKSVQEILVFLLVDWWTVYGRQQWANGMSAI